MASDRYGSARWAEAKDLKAEGVLTIPAAKVASGEGDAEVNRAFLLGCEADPAELTKGMRDGYNEMLGAISDGTSNLVRKVAGEHRRHTRLHVSRGFLCALGLGALGGVVLHTSCQLAEHTD